MRKLSLLFSLLVVSVPALAAEPHPFNVHDLVSMKRISDPQPSPKGDRIAFVLRSTDLAANRGRTDLWMVPAGGGELVQLTNDPASDDNPRWAPDGQSLYFLSSRSGSNQVWKLTLGATGAANPVAGDPSAARRVQPDPVAGRLADGVQPGGLRRLPDGRLHQGAAGPEGEREVVGAALPGRMAASSATGTPGRRGRATTCSRCRPPARGTRWTSRRGWRRTPPPSRSAGRRNSPSRRTAGRWSSPPGWPVARSRGRPTSTSTARRRTARRRPGT